MQTTVPAVGLPFAPQLKLRHVPIMRVRFVPHIAIQVRNRPEATRFYRDVLGMCLVGDASDDEPTLECDGLRVSLEDNPAGHVYLAFEVEELDTAAEILREEGCQLTAVPSPEGYLVVDPFGGRYFLSRAPA